MFACFLACVCVCVCVCLCVCMCVYLLYVRYVAMDSAGGHIHSQSGESHA